MDKEKTQNFTTGIFRELSLRFGGENPRSLGGFENFVYEYQHCGRSYILRISNTRLKRSKSQVEAEVDFVNYLAEKGVPVARAVPSLGGKLVETSADNPDFVAVSFEKASGEPIRDDQWQPEFFAYYGQVMGMMHRLTKDYTPDNPQCRRPDSILSLVGFAQANLPPSERDAASKLDQLVERLKKLPRDRDSYGLIHQDLHTGNFFVDGKGKMTIFDFDICSYNWFAADIAMTLFYSVPPNCTDPVRLKQAEDFLRHFMKGYRRENSLDSCWLQEIPTFLKVREAALFAAIHGNMDVNNLEPWPRQFMQGRRESILNDIPYLDINFIC